MRDLELIATPALLCTDLERILTGGLERLVHRGMEGLELLGRDEGDRFGRGRHDTCLIWRRKHRFQAGNHAF